MSSPIIRRSSRWCALMSGVCLSVWPLVARGQSADETNSGVAPVRIAAPAKVGAVASEKVKDVGKVAIGKASKVAPLAGGKVESVGKIVAAPSEGNATATVGLSLSAVKMPPLVARLRAREVSARALWEAGELNLEDIVYFVQSLDAWGGFHYEKDDEVRRAMVALFVKHGQSQLEQPNQLSPAMRLWLADYFWSVHDGRCVTLAHSVLDDIQTPVEGGNMLVFTAVERLGWYYRDTKQHEKSAQIWEWVRTAMPDEGWWRPDAVIQAARAYKQTGTPENQLKSERLYAQIPAFGQGWFSALALYDQVQPLLSAGQWAEARTLMAQPLGATQGQAVGTVAQNSWLASFSYQMGDLEATLHYSKVAFEAYKQADDVPAGLTRNLYDQARDLYNRSGGWKTQPIQTDTKEVVFQANPSQPDKPLYARFRIKTYGDTSITATVDNSQIQARVLPVNNWQRNSLNAQEEEMEVIVQSNSLHPFQNVPLVLSSATRGKTTTVRVSLAEAAN